MHVYDIIITLFLHTRRLITDASRRLVFGSRWPAERGRRRRWQTAASRSERIAFTSSAYTLYISSSKTVALVPLMVRARSHGGTLKTSVISNSKNWSFSSTNYMYAFCNFFCRFSIIKWHRYILENYIVIFCFLLLWYKFIEILNGSNFSH